MEKPVVLETRIDGLNIESPLPATAATTSTNPSDKTNEKKPPSKLRQLIKNYGRIVIAAYILVSVVDYLLCVWAVMVGGQGLISYVDNLVGAYIPALGRAASKMNMEQQQQASSANTIAGSKVTTSNPNGILMPLRLGLVAAITPKLAKKAQQMGLSWLVSKRDILKERHMH
ncbi:hypothetical protein H4219_005603 [Mycoemilia scoparia]|uniref:DUF1279 domain-containing protein n=1 Tax=Mycoemilia scoparia TaxID=417184 RepID=A0A9W7ZSJ1_9FUNG|nr:hypothetical protein H4219_005603 [Mycoemilia scoparia]